MTKFTVTSKPTFRDIDGRFTRANKKLLQIRRDELRDEGRHIVKLVQKKLEEKTAPYKSGKLAKGIKFNTRITGGAVRLSVTTPKKAGPHQIRARLKGALAFDWPKAGMTAIVPKKGGFKTHVRDGKLWIGKGYVDHPGGPLGPLFGPILEAAQDDWNRQRGRVVLRRISTRYVAEVTK